MSWSGGRSPRLTSSGRPSPRKLPQYSPSELSPFSFSEDTLQILASDIEKQNGIIPLNFPVNILPRTSILQGQCVSQPQTPSEERRTILDPIRSTSQEIPPPLNFNLHQPSHALLGLSHSHGGGSLGTPGKTMRDYDESFKEMKKENFNLKLRIFFLEERMGSGKKNTADELAVNNLDLKVQLESCKQDLSEKDALVAEASQALENIEKQMEAQETKHREQLKTLEDNVSEMDLIPRFDLASVPARKLIRSPDISRKPIASPKFGKKFNFFQPEREDFANNNKDTMSERLILEVLEEGEETSDVERKCNEHLKKIQGLELSVASSEACLCQVTERLTKAEKELNAMSLTLERKENEISRLSNAIKEQEKRENILKERLEQTNQTISKAQDNLMNLRLNEEDMKAVPSQDQSRCPEDSPTTKAENRKIRDQLKLQVQERKLLLKKIRMLKEQLCSVSDAKSDFDCKNQNVSKNIKELSRISEEHVQNSEHGIQCDLGLSNSYLEVNSGTSMYKEIIVSLNKKLANATNACDTLREQLEEILDTAEHVVEKEDIAKIKDVLAKSRSVSRNLSNDLNTGIISEDDMNGSFIEEKLENPLSDASTWNMELPNLADMQLCSSPELLFERQGNRFDEQFPEDVCNNVIEHLSEQIEKRNVELSQKCDYITSIEDELNNKDDIIKDQSDTINEYREEILKLEENLYGPKYCPVMDEKHKQQEKRQRKRPRRKGEQKSKIKLLKNEAQALSVDSDSWSDPDRGVSLARIGLPNSFPEQTSKCNCDNDYFLSDSEENQTNKMFYSLEFSEVILNESSNEYEVPLPDYTSIIEELRSHRQEIKKLHQECILPSAELEDLSVFECSSSACLASGQRVIEGLLATLMHQIELCSSMDSGIESDELTDKETEHDHREFSLCSKCTSSIPKEFDETLKSAHLGLSSAVTELEKVKCKFGKVFMKNELLKVSEKEAITKEEEAKSRLNENYVLIAKLSSENLRLLGEYSKLEGTIEELKKSSLAFELKLEDEICSLNGKLFYKENELEQLQVKINEFESKSLDLKEKVEHLQNNSRQKCSPDTSSSFDFFPTSGLSPVSTSATFDSFRPRAFSACTQGPSAKHLSTKLTDVSSPDLGVDMESDPFSSLERGKSHRVGSLTFDKIVQENRALKRDREVLTQKLGRSKSALQETLLRLSKSNLQKQDQVSPAVNRRPPSRVVSERGVMTERETNSTFDSNRFGARPKICTSSKSKSTL